MGHAFRSMFLDTRHGRLCLAPDAEPPSNARARSRRRGSLHPQRTLTEDRSGEGAELSLRYPTLAALARTGSPSPMGGSGPSVDDSSRLEVVGERLTPWVGSSMLMFASGLSSSVRGGRSSLGKLAAGPPAKPLFGVEGDLRLSTNNEIASQDQHAHLRRARARLGTRHQKL